MISALGTFPFDRRVVGAFECDYPPFARFAVGPPVALRNRLDGYARLDDRHVGDYRCSELSYGWNSAIPLEQLTPFVQEVPEIREPRALCSSHFHFT